MKSRRLSFQQLEDRTMFSGVTGTEDLELLPPSSFYTDFVPVFQAEVHSECTDVLETPCTEHPEVELTQIDVSIKIKSKKSIFTIDVQNPKSENMLTVLHTTQMNGRVRTNSLPLKEIVGLPSEMIRYFTLENSLQGGTGLDGSVEVLLWEDGTQSKMVDRVVLNVKPSQRFAEVLSDPHGESIPEGLLQERTIRPTMSVIEIVGPNVLVNIQSPMDSSVVQIEGGGFLDRQIVEHESGSLFRAAQVTMNAKRDSGTYEIHLMDRNYGVILDTIEVWWDQDAKELSLVDATDMWNRDALKEQYAALMYPSTEQNLQHIIQQQAKDFSLEEALNGLEESHITIGNAVPSDAAVRDTFRSGLLNLSEFKLTVSTAMQNYFYIAHPEYLPENRDELVDARLLASPGYTRAHMQDMVHRQLSDIETRIRNGVADYNIGMGKALQSAMHAVQRIMRGEIHTNVLNEYKEGFPHLIRGSNVSEMVEYTGFRIPSSDAVLREAQSMLQTHEGKELLIRAREQDLKIHQDAVKGVERRQRQLFANAIEDSERLKYYDASSQPSPEQARLNGQLWAAHMQRTYPHRNQEGSKYQTTTAQLIDAAFSQHTDPRVRAIIAARETDGVQPNTLLSHFLQPAAVSQVASHIEVALHNGTDDPEVLLGDIENILGTFVEAYGTLIAMRSPDDPAYGTLNVVENSDELTFGSEIQSYLQDFISSGRYLSLVEHLLPQDLATFFQDSQNWYTRTGFRMGEMFVSPNSSAGMVALGLAEGLRETANGNAWNGETRETLVIKASAVTGIDAREFLQVPTANADQLERSLRNLFVLNGYEVFHEDRLPTDTEPSNLRPIDIGSSWRIHFDVPSGAMVDRVAALALDETVLAEANEQRLYIDVAKSALPDVELQSLKLVVTLQDGSEVEGVTAEIQSNESNGHNLVTSETLSNDPIENVILQRTALPVTGVGWRYHNESSMHNGRSENAIDMNWNYRNEDIGKAVTASFQGQIKFVDADSGVVIIEHKETVKLNNSEQEITWWTEYRHLQNINHNLIDGTTTFINTGFQIGEVGKAGLPLNGTAHLHFVVYIGTDYINRQSIELTYWSQFHQLAYGV